jgi:hypothetical protein
MDRVAVLEYDANFKSDRPLLKMHWRAAYRALEKRNMPPLDMTGHFKSSILPMRILSLRRF